MTYQNPTYCQNLSVAFSHNTFFGETPKNENSRKLRLDYYLFGSPMYGRSFNSSEYRFGFQNQESEDEIWGEGNANFFKHRISDNRLGRFFAVDPLAAKYPYNSTYAFSENKLIAFRELEGLETYPAFLPNGAFVSSTGSISYPQSEAQANAQSEWGKAQANATIVSAQMLFLPLQYYSALSTFNMVARGEVVLSTGAQIKYMMSMTQATSSSGWLLAQQLGADVGSTNLGNFAGAITEIAGYPQYKSLMTSIVDLSAGGLYSRVGDSREQFSLIPDLTQVIVKSGDAAFGNNQENSTPQQNQQQQSTNTPNGTYIVKEGDTLWGIAKREKTSVESLVQKNNIQDKTLIHPGDELTL